MDRADIYISLDDARREVRRRWADVDLRRRVAAVLGDNFWPEFTTRPRGLFWPHIASPGNGFTFFVQCANYVGTEPLVWEYLADKFVPQNDEKHGLGRLRIDFPNGEKGIIDLVDFNLWQGKPMNKVLARTGENLVDFHHRLLSLSGYRIEVKDQTAWWKSYASPSEYYIPYLAHFVAHGILFDAFDDGDDDRLDDFTREVIYPAIRCVTESFGRKPLIVRLFPVNQSVAEDFYWWSYPPPINHYLVNYAKEENLPVKLWRQRK